MFTIMNRIADATGTPVDEGPARDLILNMGDQLGMGHLNPAQRMSR